MLLISLLSIFHTYMRTYIDLKLPNTTVVVLRRHYLHDYIHIVSICRTFQSPWNNGDRDESIVLVIKYTCRRHALDDHCIINLLMPTFIIEWYIVTYYVHVLYLRRYIVESDRKSYITRKPSPLTFRFREEQQYDVIGFTMMYFLIEVTIKICFNL